MADNYVVIATSARLSTGVLTLTKEQAKPRLHNLKAIKGNAYAIVNPVEFKRGEVFGYDGDLPKALASVLEPESEGKQKAPTKAEKKAAEAKAKAEAEAADASGHGSGNENSKQAGEGDE